MSLHATHRDAGQVTVVDLSGRIVLGDGSALLRKTIRGLLEDQRKLILLNLADVDYIDSSGIVHGGEESERGTEVAAPDEESPRSSSDHQAVHGI